LRLGGRFLEEVYCEFQFGPHGVLRDLGSVVRILRRDHDDEAVADWLTRPNESLGGLTPHDWLQAGDEVARVIDAARSHPPFD
jgi:hypothetical protein